MSYTLLTSGIATQLRFCVGVDQDGTTIREFVSSTVNAGMTIDAGVTVSSKSWSSVSRGYFQTTSTAGIGFGATKATVDQGDTHPWSFFIACAGKGTPAGVAGWESFWFNSSPFPIVEVTASDNKLTSLGSVKGSTALPTDLTTSFSVGFWKDWNVASPNGFNCYYGAGAGTEGSALVSDGSGGDGGFGSDGTDVDRLFLSVGNGNQPTKCHIICAFSGKLALADFQSLHNDWFGTLFQAAAPPPVELLGASKIFVFP